MNKNADVGVKAIGKHRLKNSEIAHLRGRFCFHILNMMQKNKQESNENLWRPVFSESLPSFTRTDWTSPATPNIYPMFQNINNHRLISNQTTLRTSSKFSRVQYSHNFHGHYPVVYLKRKSQSHCFAYFPVPCTEKKVFLIIFKGVKFFVPAAEEKPGFCLNIISELDFKTFENPIFNGHSNCKDYPI